MQIRNVCFGRFPDWHDAIRENLAPCYRLSFDELWGIDPQAFDAVFPLQQEHYPCLRAHHDLQRAKFFVPRPEAVQLCDDKFAMTQFLTVNGFGSWVPRLRHPGPPYPYVWKRRVGWFGQQCHVIRNADDEVALNLNDREWFAQALVPGDVEYATHILRARGKVRYASTFAYRMAGHITVKGAANKPEKMRFLPGSRFLNLFSEILARVGYEGTACFDYKVEYGQPMIFEVNPRFGASLTADITAYCDAYIAALLPH